MNNILRLKLNKHISNNELWSPLMMVDTKHSFTTNN